MGYLACLGRLVRMAGKGFLRTCSTESQMAVSSFPAKTKKVGLLLSGEGFFCAVLFVLSCAVLVPSRRRERFLTKAAY